MRKNNINNLCIRLSKKYNKKENLLKVMVEEANEMGYNIKECEGLIKEFYIS